MRWHFMAETVVLGESGRIVLPASIRKKFGLKGGDRLTVIEENGSIRLMSMKMALEEVRASIIAHRGSLKGILDEFIEERHEAARGEASGG
jgi:AbrB family looped-hinge helix DNA binding protein